MGRRTFEAMGGKEDGMGDGTRTIVFSRTLRPSDHPKVTVVSERANEVLAELRAQPGKDIWLFGGGALFASLLDAGLVDTVEVAVMPVLLGGGIPLLPPPAGRANLRLTGHRVYPTGIVLLEYAVAERSA
jgi:dihydrofolate reductase